MLKRFMTWLLNKIQSVLGALTGKRRYSEPDSSTRLGDEIASRLQQSNGINEADPVAVRDRSSLVERDGSFADSVSTQPMPTQSTAPLRQKSSSVLKDTVDPVAEEADTHRRLDAAPAAKPGGSPAVPSFPTDVSDLISSSASLKDLSSDSPSTDSTVSSDDVPIPNVDSSVAEQLPEIHDLLPAIEPDDSNDNIAPPIGHSAEVRPADIGSAVSQNDISSDQPADKSTDHSIQDDSDAPLLSAIEKEDVPTASRGTVDVPPVDAPVELPVVESTQRMSAPLASDSRSSDAVSDDFDFENSASEDDEQATLFSFDIVENESESSAATPDNAADSFTQTSVTSQETAFDSEKDEFQHPTATSREENPWAAARQSISVKEPESLLTKSGTVKLLFKLKPGNFHGYIAPEDGSKDILFHQKYINAEIFDDLERGSRVVATAKQMEGKVYATHVDLL